MEGGYINEGGQMKTKNGQKYIVNDTREGIFVSKSCAFLTAFIVVLTIIIAILVTYFLTAANTPESCKNTLLNNNETVASASFINGRSSTNGDSYHDDENNFHKKEITVIEKGGGFDSREIKLYEGWNPEIYRIIMEPNLKTMTTNGTVSVEIRRDLTIKKLMPIVFDIRNIIIHSCDIQRINKEIYENIDFESHYGPHNESYQINILSIIQDDEDIQLKVDLEFTSQITDTMQGIYRSPYKDFDKNGSDHAMISTQFSPIDARRAFPCFDRPDKKANFSISIIRKETDLMVLSNMPTSFTNYYRPGYLKDDFSTTPKMSTYLIAFVISNLPKANYSNPDIYQGSPQIEIWSRPETISMTKYAYNVTKHCLKFYESYFGIPYQLPKLDLISIPDFGYSGMENWGLITFRDSSLLVPEGKNQSSSANHREHVTDIIAHELAHQWFGNLVTPKWWNDLWLKEGFATYFSALATNEYGKDWNILSKFAIELFYGAMDIDSVKEWAKPIASSVSSANDIRSKFDGISYNKGAIILKMLHSFIGDASFKSGIREYLKKFAYNNAVHDDLWNIITHHAHLHRVLPEYLNVKDIMDTWTLQPGYPVVNVDRSGTDIIITQQRYSLPEKDPNDDTTWYIPINYVTETKNQTSNLPIYWLHKNQRQTIIENVFASNDSKEYIYLNHDRNGYYRVNYDMPSWIELSNNFLNLSSLTKAQLLEDSMHLARAELVTYDIPLTFLMQLGNSIDDHLLWKAASQGLQFLTFRLNREPAFETFRALMRYIVRPAFDHYKLDEPDNESHNMLAHRATVVEYACKFNYDRCTNSAQHKYREWMRNEKINLIKPNLKGTIYCTALREGSFQEWYFAYNRYKETPIASEKAQIITALGCTTKPWLLAKYLNMTIDENSGIRKQDGASAFASVASNNIGYEIAFDFLVTNIEKISNYYGDGFSFLTRMIKSITIYMDKEHHLEQLERFKKKVQSLGLKSVEQSLDLATAEVKNSIFWRSRSYYSLKEYLEALVSEFRINLF